VPIGFQLIVRRFDDAVLAPGVPARRAFAACVTRVARGWPLLAFDAADGHSHLPGLFDRQQAGRLSRSLLLGLGQTMGHSGGLEPVRLRTIDDQGHAMSLFRYTLRQEEHHGVEPDPFHEASALPDLLGLRINGRWVRSVVAERLPRIRREDLVGLLGVERT